MFGAGLGLPLPRFSKSMSTEQWTKYTKLVESHMLALRMQQPDQKLAFLTAAGGEQMVDLLESLEPENPPDVGLYVSLINDEYKEAMSKLDGYFSKATNTVQAAFEFGNLRQEQGEWGTK